ncbi:MAG TPA: ornithine cyclodeaminase family protein [Candidatus Acidoferrales bacterium]|nr:ornithine cyclodeaminase family protein [Candidatus Acidoferrales bacterium]
MPLLLSEKDVADLLTMPDAIDAVERVTRRQGEGLAIVQPRHRLQLPDKGFLHYMAGADVEAGLVGMKVYTSVRGALRFLVSVYRSSSGELLALVEADQLGMMRTGAASGVATRYLARLDAKILGLIGTGHQARGQLAAVAAVRKLERVRVFGRDASRRNAFADEMGKKLNLAVEPVNSAEEAVLGADIVTTATTTSKPVVKGEWLAPGMHINAIGANFPQKRELDDAAIARVNRIVVDSLEQSKLESGDLIQAFADDDARWARVEELAPIVAGKKPGRERADEITLFKSNGLAIWDVAAAARVIELAQAQGRGQKISMWGS